MSYRDKFFTKVSHQAIFWPNMSGKIRFVQKDGKQGHQTGSSLSSYS